MDALDLEGVESALRQIANGDNSGPTGLELVAMSIAKGDETTLANAVLAVAEAIGDLASAVRGS